MNDHQADAAAEQIVPMHVIERSALQRKVALLGDDADAFTEVREAALGFDPSAFYGKRRKSADRDAFGCAALAAPEDAA